MILLTILACPLTVLALRLRDRPTLFHTLMTVATVSATVSATYHLGVVL